MKQSFILAFFLFACCPSLSAARELSIRSGEHSDHTRLVVYTNNDEVPELISTQSGYRLQMKNINHNFDYSRVFERISRARIDELTQTDSGQLDILLKCECYALSYRLADGKFVINLFDGTDPNAPPAASALPSPQELIVEEVPEIKTQKAEVKAETARLGLPLVTGAPLPPEQENEIPPQTDTNNSPISAPLPAEEKPLYPIDEEDLLKQLARAASQGLLDPVSPSLPKPAQSAPPQPTPTKQNGMKEDPTKPMIKKPAVNPMDVIDRHIQIQTAVDEGKSSVKSELLKALGGTGCLPDKPFMIGEWGHPEGPTIDFSAEKLNLVGEFDEIDPKAFERLMKTQLFNTLGVETRAQIEAFKGDLPNREVLILIADIMDQAKADEFSEMTEQLVCDGEVALWAVLAHPRIPDEPQINAAAVMRSFSALPRHLRKHLGPMLMRKYLAIGDTETAMNINRVTERGSLDADSSAVLSSARLSLATGNAQDAVTTLKDAVDIGEQNSIEAILVLVNSYIETQEEIPDRVLGNLAALAFENRDNENKDILKHTQIIANIHNGAFVEAVALIDQDSDFPIANNEQHQEILGKLAAALDEKAPVSTFLRYSLGKPYWKNAAEPTRRVVASRLLEMGFIDAAKSMLISETSPPSRPARLIIAKALLKEGNATAALGYLAGLESGEAEELRQVALEETKRKAESNTSEAAQENDDVQLTTLTDFEDLLSATKIDRIDMQKNLDAAPLP